MSKISNQNLTIASRSVTDAYLKETPWDERALGIKTFEVTDASEETLSWVVKNGQPGHYSVKVDPLVSKRSLHQYGFYYCDTLIEPFAKTGSVITYQKEGISLSQGSALGKLRDICNGAFVHGRFHRDFNIDNRLADLRYSLWLEDLYNSNAVFDLKYFGEVIGFWGFSRNQILLHAIAEKYRGKGLSKYFWSLACQELFQRGAKEITSSISVSNAPALNLYSSLGFRFRNQREIYHLLIRPLAN